jgi:hypothetical protein
MLLWLLKTKISAPIGSHFFLIHILTLFLGPKLLNKKSHAIYLVRLRIRNKATNQSILLCNFKFIKQGQLLPLN